MLFFLVMQTDKHFPCSYFMWNKVDSPKGTIWQFRPELRDTLYSNYFIHLWWISIHLHTPLWISIIKWQHLQLVKLQNIKIISLKQNKQIFVTFFGYDDDAKVEKELCVFEYMFNHAKICTRREHIKGTGFTRN